MSYQVLARKWRPKSFASLKGQEHVTRALTNALSRGELHHAYLFTGTRGVGKTTLARILAKCLNCQQGVSATPCDQCAACLDIDKGCFPDLIEVDAASRTRVEDTRELLDNVQYAPSVGRFKIYLIDEVHMLSGHSFNALLKTLEEPPPHVKFILATTDPARIPITVLSRCLQFTLRPLSVTEISLQLKEILQSENITFEERALHAIAQAGNGSMRDALSILEQAVAFCSGALTAVLAEEMLGVSYLRSLPALMGALVSSDPKQCFALTSDMALAGADFEKVLASILQILHAFAIVKALPEAKEIAAFAEIEPQVLALEQHLTPEEVQLLYQIALMGQRDMAYSPSTRIGFEMTLLRMIAFRPVETRETVAVVAAPALAPAPAVVPAPAPAPAVVPAPASLPISRAASTSTKDILDWQQISEALPLQGLTRMLVKHSVVSKWDGQHLTLILETSQKACLNPVRQAQIQAALSQHLGTPIKLTVLVGEVPKETPMMQEITAKNEREKETIASIEQDKSIQSMVSAFDATIEKISVLDPKE